MFVKCLWLLISLMAFSGKMSRHYTSQVLLMQNQSGHNSITVLVLHEQKHLNFFKILPIWSLWCFAWYQDYYILMFNAQMPQSHPMLSQSKGLITWSFFNPGVELSPVDQAEISALPLP